MGKRRWDDAIQKLVLAEVRGEVLRQNIAESHLCGIRWNSFSSTACCDRAEHTGRHECRKGDGMQNRVVKIQEESGVRINECILAKNCDRCGR